MILIYATPEIDAFMNRSENLPEFAAQAQEHIRSIHRKYAPSNSYAPKTFDHLKELEVRKVFAAKAEREARIASVSAKDTVQWGDISA
ncbi:hypothetical protein GO495_17630 [Chitinophaga oryziterrae]|uniref:Uncharacterized protein n=1 Tax=Chitinophaga oryziterrae TaxID=1031224 RepID=A0A6N8JDG0_9BACT|nr:hypothetical protein [Chitinophaga oryziterrae]MVT42418.1 hypothetical protein [Chitinophaga oryziterrae]